MREIRQVKEKHNKVSHHRIGYNLLLHLCSDADIRKMMIGSLQVEIDSNYFGQF